jgi:hypothetical protein
MKEFLSLKKFVSLISVIYVFFAINVMFLYVFLYKAFTVTNLRKRRRNVIFFKNVLYGRY